MEGRSANAARGVGFGGRPDRTNTVNARADKVLADAVAPERVLSPEIIDRLRDTLESIPAFWSCNACGPRKRSRGNWCDAGCGSDYNEMSSLYALTRLDAHRLVVLIDLVKDLATDAAIREWRDRVPVDLNDTKDGHDGN